MIEPTVISATEPPPEWQSPLARPKKHKERLEFALPTINVIFLLMLYFLVAGTIVQKDELTVAPPETARVATARLPRPLLVIQNDGTLFLDGFVVERTALPAAAKKSVDDPKAQSTLLNILAPADMSAQPFLELLTALNAAKVPVRIVTVPPDDEAAPQ